MNNKPDKNTLISYLYEELSDEEKRPVDEWFAEHPEDKNEFRELQDAKKILSHLPDKAVIVPKIKCPAAATSFWQHNSFRIPMGIAAGFVMMLFAAKIAGIEMEMRGDGFRMGFQKAVVVNANVQELIDSAIAKNNQEISSLRKPPVATTVKSEIFSKEEVRRLVTSLQAGQTKWLKDYLQHSEVNQKKYLQGLLVDFAKYSEHQQQNYSNLEAKFDEMQIGNRKFKNETQQILTGIISGMDRQPITKNISY